MDGMSEVVDVFAGHTSHRNTTILSQINTEILGKFLNLEYQNCQTKVDIKIGLIYLRRGHASETEHPNLIGDVFPISRRSLFFQIVAQCRSHGNNSVGHSFNFLQPISSS